MTRPGPARLRERPFWGDDSRVVRYLLGLALVLQFSGVPTAWSKPCPMTAGRGEHACCVERQDGAVAKISGSCGCHIAPAPAGQLPSTISTAPEPAFDRGTPTPPADGPLLPPPSVGSHAGEPPPGPAGGRAFACLSGSGFRC